MSDKDIVKLTTNQTLFPIIALHTYGCRTCIIYNIDQLCERMTDLCEKMYACFPKTKQNKKTVKEEVQA